MEERLRFVHECQAGELPMAELCRQYAISRPTGYKWLSRYEESGLEGLRDASRAPANHPNEIAAERVQLVLEARAEHPTWGPKKLIPWLARRYPHRKLPAVSTAGAILKRHGLCVPRRRRRQTPPCDQPFEAARQPNDTWCADFKGWFQTREGSRCDPLTITDANTRYVLRCQVARRTDSRYTRSVFEACFREFGLPLRIRTDNGPPFASRALGGLSTLSLWWLKLGIEHERIAPGKPHQNGQHERMHLTLKKEAASPPAVHLRAQQAAFDAFRHEFNHERPHEALDQRTPASLYGPSPRRYPSRLPGIEYPEPLVARIVQRRGEIHWHGHKIFVTEVLAGETVGLEPLEDGRWRLYFAHLPLGTMDPRRRVVTPLRKRRRRPPRSVDP